MANSFNPKRKEPFEYVLAFDGQDDFVELPPASIPSGNEITCSFWAYGGAELPKYNSVIEAWSANNQRILNVHLIWINNCVYFDCGTNFDSYDRVVKQINVSDCKGKWTHWAFTKNVTSTEMKIYLNGEVWHQESDKQIPIPQAAKARLGCSLSSQYYPGMLAEVQLWNRELSQAEIQQGMFHRFNGDEPGLVSYWPLNEGAGAIAHDKTSNANHGTIQGNANWVTILSLAPAPASQSQPMTNAPSKDEKAATTESSNQESSLKPPIESALVFDGQHNFVELPPASIPSGNEITCSFWAYGGAELPKQNSAIAAWTAKNHRVLNIHLIWDNSCVYFDCGNTDSVDSYDRLKKQINVADCKGKWTHWAFTKNVTTGEMKIYLNGEVWHQEGDKRIPIPQATKAHLGRGFNAYYYPGMLAEVRLWNRELSQAEVQQTMSHRLKGDETGLVSYWPLNEGAGAIAHDKTRNANHGTIQGNANWVAILPPLTPASLRTSQGEKASNVPKTPTQESYISAITEIGSAGSDIAATNFTIQPKTKDGLYRIKSVSLSSGWAVDKIQVQYENLATNPPETYDSDTFGGRGGSLKSFILAPGDNLTSVSGTWGSQAPGYPKTEIISLQFHTHQGMQSQIFGGQNPQKQVEPFTLVAPEGSEIIGFFGAYGGGQNLLVRLGIYTRPRPSQNEEASNSPNKDEKTSLKPTSEYTLTFDGQNDFVTCPNGIITSSYTKEAWVKLAEPVGVSNNILSGEAHALYIPMGYLQGGHNDQWATVKDSNPCPVNTWFHVAMTYDSQTQIMSLYRDGHLVSQAKNVPPFNPSDRTLQIGAHRSSYLFKGQIAEARVWNKALSQSEIESFLSRRPTSTDLGLVGYWPLNEGSGNIAYDQTDNAYHAIIINSKPTRISIPSLTPAAPSQPAPTTETSNQGEKSSLKPAIQSVLVFDGQNDFVICPNGIITSSYTKEAWVKLAEPVGASNNILSGEAHALYIPMGYLQGGHNGQWETVKDSNPCPVNTWFHVAMTYDSQTQIMSLYRDGRLVSQAKNVPPFTPSDRTLQIGAHRSSYLFKGQIAEARVWNKGLSQAEIESFLSRRPTSTEPGLVGYWPLNEGSGNIAYEQTNNAHHAIIINSKPTRISIPSLTPAVPSQSAPTMDSSNQGEKSPLKPAIESVLIFDGQDDYVELPPASIPYGNEITCSFWAYGGAELPKYNSAIEVWSANNQRILNVHLIWINNCVYFDCGNTGASFDSYDRVVKQINVSDCKGKWTHWAFTKNVTSTEMKIYLNGELWHQEGGKKIPIPQAAKARLGCSFNSQYYPGMLAEVQLWNRELSQAEIQQGMSHRLRGDEPGLFSYWPLNEGAGAITHDKTSNANRGSIQGNANWATILSPTAATPSQPESVPTTATPSQPESVLTAATPSQPESVLTAATPSQPESVPTAATPSQPESVPTAATPSQPESVPTAATPSQPESVPTATTPSQSETPKKPSDEPIATPDRVSLVERLGEDATIESHQRVVVFNQKHQGLAVGKGALQPQSNFTIEAWIYPTKNGGKQLIFAEGDRLFYIESGELKFEVIVTVPGIAFSATSYVIGSSGAGLSADNWYHVAVTWAGSCPGDTKLYINGVHNDNRTGIPPVMFFGNTYLGGYPNMVDACFQGKLLEVRVWSFARSQAEIEVYRLYLLTGKEIGLVRCWSVTEIVDSILLDKTSYQTVRAASKDSTLEEVELPLKLKRKRHKHLVESNGVETCYWYNPYLLPHFSKPYRT